MTYDARDKSNMFIGLNIAGEGSHTVQRVHLDGETIAVDEEWTAENEAYFETAYNCDTDYAVIRVYSNKASRFSFGKVTTTTTGKAIDMNP